MGALKFRLTKGSWRCRSDVKPKTYPMFTTDLSNIACSSTTNGEVVVPLIAPSGATFAVLDVDSDGLDAFSQQDISLLETVCSMLSQRYGPLNESPN